MLVGPVALHGIQILKPHAHVHQAYIAAPCVGITAFADSAPVLHKQKAS